MIDIPHALIAHRSGHDGDAGRAFIAALPGRAARFLQEWELRRDGAARHGVCALVLPVVREADGRRAVLKLQEPDEESVGEPDALRAWQRADAGAVTLLDHDPGTGTMLLDRLDADRPLSSVTDVRAAVEVIGALLARLTSVPAPPGMRRLADAAAHLRDRLPGALPALTAESDRRLLRDCAAAVREVADEPGDRLLHWDLHYDNVLAAPEGAGETAWTAIDPKPLAGDPGFELLPALVNRFDAAEVRWRFDALTGAIGTDRDRALAWTLGRVLQNGLWSVEGGAHRLPPEQAEIARRLLGRGGEAAP